MTIPQSSGLWAWNGRLTGSSLALASRRRELRIKEKNNEGRMGQCVIQTRDLLLVYCSHEESTTCTDEAAETARSVLFIVLFATKKLNSRTTKYVEGGHPNSPYANPTSLRSRWSAVVRNPQNPPFSIPAASHRSPCLSIVYRLGVRSNGDWPNIRHGDGFEWRKGCKSANLFAESAFRPPEPNPCRTIKDSSNSKTCPTALTWYASRLMVFLP